METGPGKLDGVKASVDLRTCFDPGDLIDGAEPCAPWARVSAFRTCSPQRRARWGSGAASTRVPTMPGNTDPMPRRPLTRPPNTPTSPCLARRETERSPRPRTPLRIKAEPIRAIVSETVRSALDWRTWLLPATSLLSQRQPLMTRIPLRDRSWTSRSNTDFRTPTLRLSSSRNCLTT